MRDRVGHGDHGRCPHDRDVAVHPVDDLLQVGVGSRDETAEHVALPGDRVHFEHLGNRRQVLEHLTAVALADLEGGERGHPVAERLGFDLGGEACDDTPLDESVQARLRGRPGNAEPARQLQHAHPGLGVQLTQ